MRRYVLLIIILLLTGTAYAALTYNADRYLRDKQYGLSGSQILDPIYLNMNEVEDMLEGTTSIDNIYLEPTDTVPTATEGRFYYNETGETLMLRTSSAWRSIDLAGASSLNTAYGIGSKIDADTSYVEIEVADAADNMALLLDGDENTNNNTVMQITNAGAGIAIDIDGTDGYDIEGTAAAFRVNYTGAVECVGITNTAGDVLFDDTYDLFWDTSKDLLLANDSTLIGWGGASGDDPDFWFIYDGTDFNLNAKTANDDLKFGENTHFDLSVMCETNTAYWKFDTDNSAKVMIFEGTDAIFMDGDFCKFGDGSDWTIDSSTSLVLDIVPNTTDESSSVYLGADAAGADLKLFGATSGDYWLWDSGNEEWMGVGVDLQVDDDSVIRFGTAGDGDVTMQWDGTYFEIFAAAIDTPMYIGGTTYGFDITYYFETAGTIATDYDADTMTFSDGMSLVFGTNSDASIMYDETTDDNLEILAASVGMSITTNDFIATLDGAAANQFKVDATGTVAGNAIVLETTSGGIQLLADGSGTGDITMDAEGLISVVAAEAAADQFKVDAQGSINGDAINLETTDGGVMVNADGAAYGDIELNAADDLIISVAGDITETVTGKHTIKGAFYVDSRKIENHSASHTLTSPTDIGTLITVDTAAVVITVPAVGAGATYTVMNIGADGTEIHVDVNANDLIAGGCGIAAALDDGDKLTNTGASAHKGDYVTLSYFDATGWYVTEMNGTWADGS